MLKIINHYKIINTLLIFDLYERLFKYTYMKEELIIKVPKGYYNWAITIDNHFIADTNDSANWDELKFPLPEGNWSIHWVRLTINEAVLKPKTT